MAHFGNTPFEQNSRRESFLRDMRSISILFYAACILPILVGAAFYLGLFESKGSQIQDGLQEAVALVVTPSGSGTAFLVSPNKLLTARHVVENINVGETVQLTFERISPSISTSARLIWKDQTSYPNLNSPDFFQTDVAVLELVSPDDVAAITPLILGDSDPVRALDKVILLGYPGSDFSITAGTINNEKFNGLDLFKLDATANPGNSGGPCILESDNTVIGILVGSKAVTESENVAIKINRIKALVAQGGITIE